LASIKQQTRDNAIINMKYVDILYHEKNKLTMKCMRTHTKHNNIHETTCFDCLALITVCMLMFYQTVNAWAYSSAQLHILNH